MSHMSRIARVMVLGMALVPHDALAQRFYPGGYGGYGWGGWGGGGSASDPAAGYMAGLGSFARGRGVYEVEDAKARAINLDTMIKWNKALRTRQQQLQQEEQEQDARRRAERDARVTRLELEDGTTLNNLLMQILDFDPAASKSSRARGTIGGDAIRDIPFESNSEAVTICLDQMTGRDAMPEALGGDEFAADRDAVSRAVDAALEEDARGDVSPEAIQRVNNAVARLRAKFVKAVPKGDPDHDDAEAYFTTMAGLSRLLNDPSMKKVLAQLDADREISVGDLIGFMQAYNLRFGPAMTARQVQIYRTLVTLLQGVHGELGASTPAPSSPEIADKDGKGLQSAAREAFKGMSWPQLEAHSREP